MSRRKYTFEQRLEVVMHYLATDEGYRLTSARFNVPRTQVRLWVAAYDVYGEEGLKPRDKGVSIDPEIRVEAVKAVLTGQISQTQAAAKFNVAGAASVGKWMKVFSEHGEQGLRSLRVGKKRALHMKWFTEFGHLNRGDMLTSEQHRCHNEKKKFQRRV
ncbi:transposase [Klebsiella pneumoniae]|nr:transposase [Klebsiella pneumoniae]